MPNDQSEFSLVDWRHWLYPKDLSIHHRQLKKKHHLSVNKQQQQQTNIYLLLKEFRQLKIDKSELENHYHVYILSEHNL